MRFKYQSDNENLTERLERMVKTGTVSHAYIFEGPGYVDKKAFAESFARVSCALSLAVMAAALAGYAIRWITVITRISCIYRLREDL